MSRIKSILIVLNLAAVLAYFAYAIHQKEDLLEHGPQVRLRLAPIDPRSLMQGDYMRLNFEVLSKHQLGYGYIVVSVPDGQFLRVQHDKSPVSAGEVALRIIDKDSHRPRLSSDNYFFEEGTAVRYAEAQSALAVVDDEGNIYIRNLCDSLDNVIDNH